MLFSILFLSASVICLRECLSLQLTQSVIRIGLPKILVESLRRISSGPSISKRWMQWSPSLLSDGCWLDVSHLAGKRRVRQNRTMEELMGCFTIGNPVPASLYNASTLKATTAFAARKQ